MVGVVTFIFSLPFVFASCRQEVKPSVDFVYDPEIIPSMRTVNDTMLISDSGLIRYNMIVKTWDVFEQSKDPNWFFPDGLYIEQFDTAFQVVVTIKADTAWNYTKRKLWRLKGHVFVRNTLGETFSSEELFWNQQLQKIYLSDYVSRIDDNVFDNSSKTVFYCNYDSYATVYAIEHDILFVSTGNSTGDVNKSILDKNNTSYYGDFNNMTANGYVAMNIKYSV